MSGLSAGVYINSILSSDQAVTDLVGDKIFPNVVNREITFPFIIYEIEVSTERTKDGVMDSVNATISIGSDKYAEAIRIGEAVREALDMIRDEGKGVRLCVFDSGQNFMADDTVVQILKFNILMK